MSWANLKPVGETLTAELLAVMPVADAIKVLELMRSRVTEHQCGDLAMIADRLFDEFYAGGKGEFNLGAIAIILNAGRRAAMKRRHEKPPAF